MGWFILIVGVICLISWISDLLNQKKEAGEKLASLQSQVYDLISARKEIDKKVEYFDNKAQEIKEQEKDFEKRASKVNEDLNELIRQRAKGFPLIGEVYQEYFDIKAKIQEEALLYKRRPAPRAAEAVKESNREKRRLIKEMKVLEYKMRNFEAVAPFLTEIEEEMPQDDELWALEEYSEEESEDMVTRFVTKDEYRKMSVSERNQLALDRYWTRRKKSKWLIGKIYERFVGFLYEKDGWQVEYFGIKKRYEDYGRDLIATKGKECHIVQCKHWNKYKMIYENHIFQLFGTTYEYQSKNPSQKVTAVFYTSTKLSDSAKNFANRLGLKIIENKSLDSYPSIKCNISRKTGEKIYHLPFDQQYDTAKIDSKGEFYCATVVEAEKAGFRRAFRWHDKDGITPK